MASIQVGSIISEAWSLTKKNLVLILFVVVASCITSALQPTGLPEGVSTSDFLENIKSGDVNSINEISQSMQRNQFNSPVNVIRYILSILVSIVLGIGLSNTFLMISKGTMTSISLKGFALPVNVYVKAFLTTLLSGIIMGISAMLCIIPLFYVAPKVMFSYFYILDGRANGVVEAIKMNWEDSNGEVGSLILLGLAAFGLNILGLLCCCCGMLVTETVQFFAEALAFLALAANRTDMNASGNSEITNI